MRVFVVCHEPTFKNSTRGFEAVRAVYRFTEHLTPRQCADIIVDNVRAQEENTMCQSGIVYSIREVTDGRIEQAMPQSALSLSDRMIHSGGFSVWWTPSMGLPVPFETATIMYIAGLITRAAHEEFILPVTEFMA